MIYITARRVPSCCVHGNTDTCSFHHLQTCSAVKLSQLLGHQPLLDRYLGFVDLKEMSRLNWDVSVLWDVKHRHVYATLNGSLIPMMQFKWLLK